MTYVVYNKTGKMLRGVNCSSNQKHSQAKEGEFVMKGMANDATQKVKFDGFDEEGQPINPRIVNKTPEEIEADNPTPPKTPFGKLPADITNKQLQDILKRLDTLEKV